jgi:NADPH:quinone reductase-like Zn-dependent oxidoreductase
MTAASLNYRDVLISTRSPQYPGNHKPNLVPGSDGAGVIYSTGADSNWKDKKGLAVVFNQNGWLHGDFRNLDFATILGGTSQDGTLQEYLVLPDDWIVEQPPSLSAVEAACLITAGSTAWWAIRGGLDGRLDGSVGDWQGSWRDRRLDEKWVLTLGTGGVSCFAIQIASALGATVIATSSSDSKLEIAKNLGAAHLINYVKTPNWDEEVSRITGGKGVDHVIETGGAGTLMKSINSTRAGGLISMPGVLTPNAPIDAAFIPSILFSAKTVKGCCAFPLAAVVELAQFVEAHGIKPVVAHEFTFDQTIEAFDTMARQSAVGKIALRICESA